MLPYVIPVQIVAPVIVDDVNPVKTLQFVCIDSELKLIVTPFGVTVSLTHPVGVGVMVLVGVTVIVGVIVGVGVLVGVGHDGHSLYAHPFIEYIPGPINESFKDGGDGGNGDGV